MILHLAKEILKNVGQLERHLKAYTDFHKKIGNHLETTVNSYNLSTREFGKIDKDIMRLTGESIGVERELILGTREASEL